MQKTYFLSQVELYDRKQLALTLPRALVSSHGIYRVFEESENIYKSFLEGRIYTLKMDECLIKARLIREQGKEGSHYNLHLLQTEDEAKNHVVEKTIKEKLQKNGFESPWKRAYPRISTTLASPLVEAPVGVIFPRIVGSVDAEVVNYSSHGMLFEFLTTGLSKGEYIGQKIQFHIVSNQGRLLNNFEAEIIRIYDQMIVPRKLIRGLGVKFIRIPKDSQDEYNDFILDAATEMKNGFKK